MSAARKLYIDIPHQCIVADNLDFLGDEESNEVAVAVNRDDTWVVDAEVVPAEEDVSFVGSSGQGVGAAVSEATTAAYCTPWSVVADIHGNIEVVKCEDSGYSHIFSGHDEAVVRSPEGVA